MSRIQKFVTACGVFWLSLWIAPLVGWPLEKLTNRIIYTDTIANAFALGVVNSLDLAIAAAAAGISVTQVIVGRKPAFWSLIVGALYMADPPVRYHWGHGVSSWDRLWQAVALVFPAIACIAAAFITARVRRKSNRDTLAHTSAARSN